VIYRFGEFELSPGTYELRRAGARVHVEPRVFELLAFLLGNRARVVTKDELLERLWGGQVVSESALSGAVRDARKALGGGEGKERWIQTVHGRGFRFAGPVEEVGAAAVEADPASVALLPFRELGAEREESFAAGITEDVLAQLVKIRSLTVIAQRSVAAATAAEMRERSLRELGALLGARTLLQGSVRRAGNRVRIVAELVDAASGRHLWAETYDRELDDLFAIQGDVALRIAEALRGELTADERARVGVPPTGNLHAYQLYLQGRLSYGRYTPDGIRQGIRYFERAIAEDPAFALAHVGLARAYAEIANEGFADLEPPAAYARARALVSTALALDDSLSEAHGIAALLAFTFDYDWEGAERGFRRAIELAPGNADAWDHYGWLLQALERWDEALRVLRRARELDPLSHQTDLATTFLRAGMPAAALEIAERAIEFDAGKSRGHSVRGWALIQLGRQEEGVASLERAVECSPGSTIFLGQLGQAYATTGRADEARDVLGRMREAAARRYVSPYHIAYVLTGLGEVEAALDALERAFDERSPIIAGIRGSFLFRSLHGHPRFTALLRKMNLA
jgi:serine/threonine-protein kinase